MIRPLRIKRNHFIVQQTSLEALLLSVLVQLKALCFVHRMLTLACNRHETVLLTVVEHCKY